MLGKTDNGEFSGVDAGAQPPRPAPVCPACGTSARRTGARYCVTCGRAFERGGYLPSDSIRASYHQQHRRYVPSARYAFAATPLPLVANRPSQDAPAMLFKKKNNNASDIAMAFVVYSLVPYLGILFCPGALVMGGVGLMRSRVAPHGAGRRNSLLSIVLGLVVLCVQIALWWILYKVPEWSRESPF